MDETPTHLDLFSGIGGFALAAQWAGFRTVAFCEIDKYCQLVLTKNFGAEIVADSKGGLPWKSPEREGREDIGRRSPKVSEDVADAIGDGELWETETRLDMERDALDRRERDEETDRLNSNRPTIHANIFDFDGTHYRGCDLLTGGFPCQPFSVAGKRRGAADDRAIWPEMLRVIGEARPAWVLAENVPGIIPMELDNVLSSLERIGYACRTFVIPACAVDARHRRDRVWIVGRNVANLPRVQPGWEESWAELERTRESGEPENALADATSEGTNGHASGERTEHVMSGIGGDASAQVTFWLPEPDVGRVAHGIPSRVDRLKGLGNAIVPQVAYEILREIRRMI